MTAVTRTDTDIQKDVLDELGWDPQIEVTEVGVEVDAGVVTLTGWVDAYAKKLAAERAAQRVEGVRAVANDLSVRTAGTWTDTDVAKVVANGLEANSNVPDERLDITVKNGKVTLTGDVDWDYQRTAAVESIRHLAGVRDVINRITIKQPKISAVEIKTGIERALVRAAEVDASRIKVHSEGGLVRLTGIVRSWPEKRAAAEAAWKAKGVTGVLNEIEIRPG